jgi:hypothetical protein
VRTTTFSVFPLRYVPDSDEIVRWVRSNGIVLQRRHDRCKAVVLDALADEPQQRTPSTSLQPERADSLVSLSSHIQASQDGFVSHTPSIGGCRGKLSP